jgi:hypothetical protein
MEILLRRRFVVNVVMCCTMAACAIAQEEGAVSGRELGDEGGEEF